MRLVEEAVIAFETNGPTSLTDDQLDLILNEYKTKPVALPGIGIDECPMYLVDDEDIPYLSSEQCQEFLRMRGDLSMFKICAFERKKRG